MPVIYCTHLKKKSLVYLISMLHPAWPSLPPFCGTAMTTLTHLKRATLLSHRNGKRWMVWYHIAGCHRNTISALWYCIFMLTQTCDSIPQHRLKVISGCIAQTFQWSPDRATHLWLRLSIQRSTACKTFRSLFKDDRTSSCTCICHVAQFEKLQQ